MFFDALVCRFRISQAEMQQPTAAAELDDYDLRGTAGFVHVRVVKTIFLIVCFSEYKK